MRRADAAASSRSQAHPPCAPPHRDSGTGARRRRRVPRRRPSDRPGCGERHVSSARRRTACRAETVRGRRRARADPTMRADAPSRTRRAPHRPPARQNAARREATMRRSGGVPERPKGTGCKPVGSAYGGSNPPASLGRLPPHSNLTHSRETDPPWSLEIATEPGYNGAPLRRSDATPLTAERPSELTALAHPTRPETPSACGYWNRPELLELSHSLRTVPNSVPKP